MINAVGQDVTIGQVTQLAIQQEGRTLHLVGSYQWEIATKTATVGQHQLVRVRQGGSAGALYGGRGRRGVVGGVGERGEWGNPHAVGPCRTCGDDHPTAAATLPLYTSYLLNRLDMTRQFADRFDQQLAQHDRLACFCLDTICHTAVMALVWQERNHNKESN